MKVVVGSLNPVKIKAVREVLTRFYNDLTLIGFKVDTGVPKQPFGMEETIRGAINRAEQAGGKGDFGVGIEAGLVGVPFTKTGYFDIQFCAITDGRYMTLGSGSGFEYPTNVIKEVKKGKTVGEAMEEISGITAIGHREGAVGFLSKGHLTRLELTKQVVLAAFIPRIKGGMG